MSKRSLIAIAALCAALVLPGVAAAQSVAYAAGDGYTNLRSGPSTSYPVIARAYPGSRVDVLGCLETRAWCDVIVQDTRGWIYANRLEFVYGGRRVLVPDYYPYFGAPYVIFRFGDDDHSRRRSVRDHSRRRSAGDDGHSRRRSADGHSRRRSSGDDGHSRRRSGNEHSRWRSENDNDNYKEGFHPPGGGDPGPEYIRPPRTENVPADGSFGHPGGGGPGPDRIRPGRGGTIEVPADGSGGAAGGCQPGSPECVDVIR